jgi:hypothetical protein
MVGLLALGLVLVNVLGRSSPRVNKEEAVAIARPHIDFRPQGYQIRFIRQGIPSRGVWVVSFYIRNRSGGYRRVTNVLVDSNTGTVVRVLRVT